MTKRRGASDSWILRPWGTNASRLSLIPASCALQPQVHPNVLGVFSHGEFPLASRHLGTVHFSAAIQLLCATALTTRNRSSARGGGS